MRRIQLRFYTTVIIVLRAIYCQQIYSMSEQPDSPKFVLEAISLLLHEIEVERVKQDRI